MAVTTGRFKYPSVARTYSVPWRLSCSRVQKTNNPATGRAELLPISEQELRQVSGCTSAKTTVTFTLPGIAGSRNSTALWSDVYVLDDRGAILSRTELPRLQR